VTQNGEPVGEPFLLQKELGEGDMVFIRPEERHRWCPARPRLGKITSAPYSKETRKIIYTVVEPNGDTRNAERVDLIRRTFGVRLWNFVEQGNIELSWLVSLELNQVSISEDEVSTMNLGEFQYPAMVACLAAGARVAGTPAFADSEATRLHSSGTVVNIDEMGRYEVRIDNSSVTSIFDETEKTSAAATVWYAVGQSCSFAWTAASGWTQQWSASQASSLWEIATHCDS
jgi:hypothetical protein